MYSIKQASRKIQNYVSTNTELENLIRELTNTDPWGPSSQQLYDLNLMVLSTSKSDNYRITEPPLRVDGFPKSENISISSKTIFHLFNRISQYSNITTRYLSFPKLRSYLNNEKPPLFQNYTSGKLYESIKKNYITQGLEFRIISKSLNTLEYLLINCFDDNYDIKLEISCYAQYLDQISEQYICDQAVDHKMKFHTDSIRSKCKLILTLLTDKTELQQKRDKIHNVSSKINHQSQNLNQNVSGTLTKTRPGRSISWSLKDQYQGVNKIGLQLSEDYNGLNTGVKYNDQDLSGYLQNGIEYNDNYQVYDSMPGDDGDDFLHKKKNIPELVFEKNNKNNDSADDYDEFGDLQKADVTMTKEMDLLDLSDDGGAMEIHEPPLSPTSVSRTHFNDVFDRDDSKKYILDESVIKHTPKLSAPLGQPPATTTGSAVSVPTKGTPPNQKLSVFDDLFNLSKEENNLSRNF